MDFQLPKDSDKPDEAADKHGAVYKRPAGIGVIQKKPAVVPIAEQKHRAYSNAYAQARKRAFSDGKNEEDAKQIARRAAQKKLKEMFGGIVLAMWE